MKTTEIYKMINSENVKEIKESMMHIYKHSNISTYSNEKKEVNNFTGEFLLQMIVENSNDFTKDISEKCLKNQYELSEKQSWCCAYQIKNNKNVYLNSVLENWKENIELMKKDEETFTKSDVEREEKIYNEFISNL